MEPGTGTNSPSFSGSRRRDQKSKSLLRVSTKVSTAPTRTKLRLRGEKKSDAAESPAKGERPVSVDEVRQAIADWPIDELDERPIQRAIRLPAGPPLP